jgi:hypothetical protein
MPQHHAIANRLHLVVRQTKGKTNKRTNWHRQSGLAMETTQHQQAKNGT